MAFWCFFVFTKSVLGQCYQRDSDIHIEQLKTSQQLYRQGVDTTHIDSVFKALEEGILLKNQYAALFLADHNERDAIGLIKKKYEQEKRYVHAALRYLQALNKLNYSAIEDSVQSFTDSLYQKIAEGQAGRSEYYVYSDLVEMQADKKNYSQFPRIVELLKSKVRHKRTLWSLLVRIT